MVVGSFPAISETFIVTKFLGLLDRGVDVEVIAGRRSNRLETFPGLKERQDIRRRVRVVPYHGFKALVVALMPFVLLWKLLTCPEDFMRFARHYFRKFGFRMESLKWLYLRTPFMGRRYDLIHVEFGYFAPQNVELKEILGCKLVCSFRGSDIAAAPLKNCRLYEEVFGSADALHLASGFFRKEALRRGCRQDMPYAVITGAVDTAFFCHGRSRPGYSGDGPLRLVTVSRLTWLKGYDYALEAVRFLITSGLKVRYRIVGPMGDAEDAIRYAIDDMRLSEVVTIAGPASRESVRSHYEWADIYLHPSVQEGISNAVLEAQSMQLPVVVSDAGALPEAVEDGVTGFLVPRRDARAMAEKIKLLADDPALRGQMGQAGRKRVLEKFRIEDQIDKFYTLYRNLLEGNEDGLPRMGDAGVEADTLQTVGAERQEARR